MKGHVRPSLLAAAFGVDLKTIHNWADKGQIPEVRTPGGQRRYRAPDAVAFMKRYGISVPPELEGVEPTPAT